MNNLFIIARFELFRLFLTARGWVSLFAFALVWAILLRYVIYNASVHLIDENTARLIGGLTGNRGVQNLLAWPVAEIAVFWGIALYLFPLFSIVLTADQTASDRARGTLRLINLRATRDGIFFGRFTGQMIIQSLLIIITIVSVVALAIFRDPGLSLPSFSLSLLVIVNLLIVLLPYTALMALVSAMANSARMAIIYASILWLIIFILINWFSPRFPVIASIEWVLPGAQLADLLEKEGWDTLSTAYIPILQSIFLLLMGRWVFTATRSVTVVNCANLSKHYGSKTALDSVNLSIEPGEPVALIGPNGAGKTTLLSLLCGYIHPSGGDVKVLGETPGSAALNGRLTALPQDAQFDPRFSIGTQLHLYARLQDLSGSTARHDVNRVLDLVGLPDAKNQKPSELSHGMRKRVAIAQALLGKPELVLLDEPTAGLDPPNAKTIRELIAFESQRTTFVVSSHNLDELEKLCSTVIHLDQGRLKDHVDISDSTNDGFLTVKLVEADMDQVCAVVANLSGVIDVSQNKTGAIVLQYNADSHPTMDQSLLKLLGERNWVYKHLIKGRTLEDKLF